MTQVEAAHDFLAREFGPETGFRWCGVDLARMSRGMLVEVVKTLGHRPTIEEFDGASRDRLIYLAVCYGKLHQVWKSSGGYHETD